MTLRTQLPVATPISMGGLRSAAAAALRRDAPSLRRVEEAIRRRFGAHDVLLADSGTSALVLAFRLLRLEGRVIALPGYCCPDVTAAAAFAGARVRLYDLDPATLSPDLDSVHRALTRGVDAIVVAHLYGYAADFDEVSALAARAGVPVVEDAAQGAGGSYRGRPMGALGRLSVVSFGRGKGLGGGGGGALLSFDPERAADIAKLRPRGRSPAGLHALASTIAQCILGRPALYGIPTALPFLRLGETIVRPAHEPMPISRVAAALAADALLDGGAGLPERRRRASVLRAALSPESPIRAVAPIAGSDPGYLRFALVDRSGRLEPSTRLGALRGYASLPSSRHRIWTALLAGEASGPGSRTLSEGLLTLPTHHLVTSSDLGALASWLSETPGGPAHRRVPSRAAPSVPGLGH